MKFPLLTFILMVVVAFILGARAEYMSRLGFPVPQISATSTIDTNNTWREIPRENLSNDPHPLYGVYPTQLGYKNCTPIN